MIMLRKVIHWLRYRFSKQYRSDVEQALSYQQSKSQFGGGYCHEYDGDSRDAMMQDIMDDG